MLTAEPRATYVCSECDEEQLVYVGEAPEDATCPECRRRREQQVGPEDALVRAGVPRRIAHYATAGYRPDMVSDRIRTALSDWPPKELVEGASMLLLTGPTGVGKSVLAARVLFRALQAGHHVAYATARGLIRELHESYSGERAGGVFARYLRAGVMALDDLGTEQGTPHDLTKLGDLVDYRWATARPTIFTTNLPLKPPTVRGKVIESAPVITDYDPRLVSRLLSGLVLVVNGGDDLRLGGR